MDSSNETPLINEKRTVIGKGLKLEPMSYRDVVWGLIFGLNFFLIFSLALSYGLIALSTPGPRDLLIKSSSVVKVLHSHESAKFIIGVFLVIITAIAVSFGWIVVMARYASKLILLTILLAMSTASISGFAMFRSGFVFLGLTFLAIVFSAFGVLMSMRSRIQFAAFSLSTASAAILNNPSIFAYAFGVQFLQLLWFLIWVIAAVGVATNESIKTISYHARVYRLVTCTTFTYSAVSTKQDLIH